MSCWKCGNETHLEEPDGDDDDGDGLHDVGVVLEQGLAAALLPNVEFLCLVVIVVVGRVVGDLVLDAGPRRVHVTAAEGHAVHQVLAPDVVSQTAGEQRRDSQSTEEAG